MRKIYLIICFITFFGIEGFSKFSTQIIDVDSFKIIDSELLGYSFFLKQKSDKSRKLYLNVFSSYNYESEATTNSIGLKDNFAQKYNYFVCLGLRFLRLKKVTVSIESGFGIRDYGFRQNNSTIPYFTIPVTMRLRIGKENSFLGIEIFGGGEYAKLYSEKYQYTDTNNPSNNSHNMFLHSNDAITGVYGGVLVLGKGKIKLFAFSETVIQLDDFDLQYGQTIGATALGAGLRFNL